MPEIQIDDLNKFCSEKVTNGHYAHPGDCGQFIQCYNQRMFIKACPSSLVWNTKITACDWKRNVRHC